MARQLKTFTTSAGFFDLAVSAPSMKAALEAWGSKRNLFHDGFAQVSEDPGVVAAAMAKPGVVLRRPIGTDLPFSEHAELPSDFGEREPKPKPKHRSARKEASPPVDEKRARAAAAAFEREQQRRQREAQREEAAQAKAQEQRERAITAAQTALDDAERAHKTVAAEFEKKRRDIERSSEAEEARWTRERERLEAALRKAKSPTHLRLVKK